MSRVSLFALIAAAFFLSSSFGDAGQSPASKEITLNAGSEAARHIILATVTRRKITDIISATATVEPNANTIANITTRIPAIVIKLIAQPGQQVEAGQPLAILSSVELGQAKTDYLKTRSILEISRQNLQRQEQLFKKKITPFKDVLAARAAYDTARAQYETAREKVRLLLPRVDLAQIKWSEKSPLSDFPLVSPIDGTLVRRELALGQALDRNNTPMTVIDLNTVWVMTNVFEHDLADLRLDSSASIRVDAYPDRTFTGRVVYIGDEVDRRTRTVAARIEAPNPEHLLKPGMFARAEIQGASPSRDALVVPDSAVYDYDGAKVAFVALGRERFAPRRVTIGNVGEDGVEITSGLIEGEQVVAHGGLALKALLINRPAA